ncbi:MAG: BamA/TamA family outer membrane protein [Armatimonadetes bacterium]|nr:BamA/TamA family outer membrane protein [Armatimonadota bacterium]
MNRFCVLISLLSICAVTYSQNVIVKTITVRGNKIISSAAVMAAMVTREGDVLRQEELRNDEGRILNIGFFKGVQILTRPLVSEFEVEVVVDLVENPIIIEVFITGNTVVSTERLTEIVTEIQELGRILNNRNLRLIRDALEEEYFDRGYFMQIDRLEPDPLSEGTLRIAILEPIVDDIRFIGLNRTKPSVIRRIMKTKPGVAFSELQFRRDREELFATYWFDNITARTITKDEPAHYDLEMVFVEARTGQFNAGVSLDPQSNLVGQISFSESNWRGMGQTVSVNLSQATRGGGVSAELGWGDRFFDTLGTSINARVYSRVVYHFTGNGIGGFNSPIGGQFNERRTGGTFVVGRPLNDTIRAFIGVRAENLLTLNVDPGATNFIMQDGVIAVLQLGLDHNTRHPSVESYEGHLARIMLEPTYTNINKIAGTFEGFTGILGPNYFLRTTLEYRSFWSSPVPEDTPVDKPRSVVAFRIKYGVISGDVPFFEQLFVGGSDSLRGYTNQRFWGKQSLLATLEYRYPIQRSFSVVAFTDYGGAWGGYGGIDSFTQSSKMDLRLGYGLGVSFRTPIGPIRIDFAFNQDGGSRTHFTFGTSF